MIPYGWACTALALISCTFLLVYRLTIMPYTSISCLYRRLQYMVTQSGLGVQAVAYCGDFFATAKEVGDVAMVSDREVAGREGE